MVIWTSEEWAFGCIETTEIGFTKIEFLTRFSLSVNGSRKRMQYGIGEVSSLLIVCVFFVNEIIILVRSLIRRCNKNMSGKNIQSEMAFMCVCLMPRYVWAIEIELHLFSCFARHFIVIAEMPVEMTNEISIICVLDVRRQAPFRIYTQCTDMAASALNTADQPYCSTHNDVHKFVHLPVSSIINNLVDDDVAHCIAAENIN